MRDVYTAKLSRLSDEILEMGNLCGQAIMKTCQLLASVEVREAATKEIGRIEKEIDDKEHNIEALCMQLLLKQQPVGTDLRKISAALKMVTDMERIGDQATDIAEILNTGSVHIPVTAIPLQEMADYAMHMVNDSVTAYVEGKSDLAKKVISSDNVLDNLFDKVRNALDQNTMDFSSDEVLDLLMISKYYERIGDHATNIGEWAEFSVDGIHRNGDSISDLFNPDSYNKIRACLKNHSRNLHAPLCGRFHPNSVAVARYGALIRAKSPTNCDAHLAESLFQTRSSIAQNRKKVICQKMCWRSQNHHTPVLRYR